ncbi:hypothetical protein CC86DRAFT_371028 [Ophiobolus disseminans]|uniref:Uncharacterized protein n=1 Tax=Ophiobolus disseminans TaxID=1469910 RepID=A0A6A6ZXU4_9PLEO|nr:hypothetical protein CC86DRAFT_371028 [Ophiobolus disseminans]
MATPLLNKDSSQPPSTLPTISVCISIASDTFDLTIFTPFKIGIALTLHHHQPITFRTRDIPLFDRPFTDPGLTFTNTRNRQAIAGIGPICNFYFTTPGIEGPLPSETNKDHWTTLFPEQPHNVDTAFEPVLAGRTPREQVAASMLRFQMPEIQTMKWPWMHQYEDRQVYRIGVSSGAGVKEWIGGSLDEILELRKGGVTPNYRHEKIEFEVRETGEFEVRRPDRDGSLSWP